ncbi:MAG: magnesium transporter CorA family protein [Clostridia bacterium]|nr:MAG: magnesium transporter CorA family protein [Clostridia bacterium]
MSTEDGLREQPPVLAKGSWIYLIAPTKEEMQEVSRGSGIPLDFLEYPLDEEEIPRIEFDDSGVLVIIRVPVARGSTYDTVPLGIIITEDVVITVCPEDNPVISELGSGRAKGFYTFKRTRFLLHILFNASVLYLRYLRQIDRKSEGIRIMLEHSTRNKELMDLLDLGKSLVYFTASLRSNEIVMEKILKLYLSGRTGGGEEGRFIKMYEEDRELLEDVITENKQAIEMGDIYTSILNSTMDAFASVISNNLNIVMKFLTAVTIILMIPTTVASFYGMNVLLPGQSSPYAFTGTLLVSALFSIAVTILFRRRHMF